MVLLAALLERTLSGVLPRPIAPRHGAEDHSPQHTINLLTILSLAFASISVVATLSILYWFVKMRRGFRHELIMLLIQSDFIKSAAFVVFPIVNLIRGTVASDSVFCQISGFGLAVGIESSDIAVLLIALHSVMYIFRPRSGLYPYRRAAYLAYYLFPVIIASLSFINGSGYENVGHYCYLRTDNGWRRMALGWIPRYIIGIGIVMIYAFIYLYIRRRMDDYGRKSSVDSRQRSRPLHPPRLPRISCHGLLPSAPNSRRGSGADSVATKHRHRSISSTSSIGMDNNHAPGINQDRRASSQLRRYVDWNWAGFRQPRSSEENPFPEDTHDPLSPNPAPISTPPQVHSPRAMRQVLSDEHSNSSSGTSPRFFWRRPISPNGRTRLSVDDPTPVPHPNVSLPNIMTMLRKGPPPQHQEQQQRRQHTAESNTPDYHHPTMATAETSPILISPGYVFEDETGVARNREKIRRQLRSLFAYPLVYMIIWVFPFVSHVMGYDDAVRPGDPEWLLILGIISLCVQGTVDSALFAIREKPWRYARGKFWNALGKRLTLSFSGNWRDEGLAGRTREEMMVDGRLARERRNGEIASERALRANLGQEQQLRKEVREWWDVEVDGAPFGWEVEIEEEEEEEEVGQGV